jgi:hypothetical protein
MLGNFRDALIVFLGTLGTASFAGLSVFLDGAGLNTGITLLGAGLLSLIPPRIAYRWWRTREDATMADLHRRLLGLVTSPTRPETGPPPVTGPSK